MALVFQYGSNTCTARLNSPGRLNGAARRIGLACTLEDREFDFTVWSRQNGCAAADLLPGGGRRIWGVLYEVPDPLIRRETAGGRISLDAVEREGLNYRRTRIAIALRDGTEVSGGALTYVVRRPVAGLRTSAEYVGHILRGLRHARVPDDYLAYLKRRILANNPALHPVVRSA